MAEAEEISAFMIARHTNVNLFYFPMTLHYPIHASFPLYYPQDIHLRIWSPG